MAAADRRAVTEVFINIGKSLAAYERRIQPGAGRFDTYVAAVLAGDRQTARRTFDADEAAGLRLFIGPARCTDCHAGPRLTNDSFHNIGLPLRELPSGAGHDAIRMAGACAQAMLFVRCGAGGISHSPEETLDAADADAAARAFDLFLQLLDQRMLGT